MADLVAEADDNSEYWRTNEITAIVQRHFNKTDRELCQRKKYRNVTLTLPSTRTVRPICRSKVDYQLCPQCARLSNYTECELFRDSCRERKVANVEHVTYCDQKYGKWRAVLIPADYTKCRCCDECVFFRELDQSCVSDDYVFEYDEFLPVSTIDFRAGCNPYLGHPDQKLLALRCDKVLRRCVPASMAPAPAPVDLNVRRQFRHEAPPEHCSASCKGVTCPRPLVHEGDCRPGAFLPNTDYCNCCGLCTYLQQLNEKCAEFRKTIHIFNGSKEIEVEEEFIEPGCDDGLVCRHGYCQDIHVLPSLGERRNNILSASEPCKREMKRYKKMYGREGHLHYNAPQCTPLWLYAPVQCRRFMCYCALEDGSKIAGVKMPRIDASYMNCDCARAKCRTDSAARCDAYGNYATYKP